MKRKLPAFARELLAKRERGLAPRRDLLIATDWNSGKAWRPWRIVVAPEDDPAELDFSVVAGLSCLLVGHDQARLDTVAAHVAGWDPKRLVGVRLGRETKIYVAAPSPQAQAA
jgi:hypothetical protein